MRFAQHFIGCLQNHWLITVGYMEVVRLPRNDTICKWYVYLLIDIAEDLGPHFILA